MGTLSRRAFMTLAAVPALARTRTVFSQDAYEALINDQYANLVRLRQAGGQYLGSNFKLTPTPTNWLLKLGRYRGKYGGHKVDLRGYWIFAPGSNKCWQVKDRGGGPFRYWNEDGAASGTPQDWELFRFARVDAAHHTVKVFNGTWEAYRRLTGTLPNGILNWRNSVGLVGDDFSCNESFPNAAIFTVEFP